MMNKATYEEQLLELQEQHRFALHKISHEIRNPVTVINSLLQLITDQHPEVNDFECWDQILDNMEFLKSLLNEISTFNRSSEVRRQTINVYYLLERIVMDAKTTLSGKNIEIQLQKHSALPPIDADSVKLREVFLNLIRNSSEAIGENGNITIGIGYENDSVVITFADDGPGIPEEYLPTIFEPFVTHKKEGTGLGLAIAKNIITSHYGTISVESEAGNGTVFTVSLPI